MKVWDTSKDYGSVLCVTGDHQAAWCVRIVDSSVFVGCEDFTITAWSLTSSQLLFRLIGHTAPVRTLLPINGVLFSGSDDGSIRMWRREIEMVDDVGSDGEERESVSADAYVCVGILKGHNGGVRDLERVGGLFMSASVDGSLRSWNISTGNETPEREDLGEPKRKRERERERERKRGLPECAWV